MWTKSRTFDDDDPPEVVFDDLRDALSRIGKVREEETPTFLRGTTWFGLERVSIKVSLHPKGSGSAVEMEAFAGDYWGVGAKSGLKRLLRAAGRGQP